MKTVLLILATVVSVQAHALVMMKCTTTNGKTLWASFGSVWRSGDTVPSFFPVEIVLFKSDSELQERLLFTTFDRALQVPVRATSTAIGFEFPVNNLEGRTQTEGIKLIRGRDEHSFAGSWVTTIDGDPLYQETYCTVY